MGLKRRNNDRVYLYRSYREGKRVRTEYVTCGALAKTLAEAEADLQARRKARRVRLQKEQQQLRLIEKRMKALHYAAKLMLRVHLYSAGYHQPNHGPWRKRRKDHAWPITWTRNDTLLWPEGAKMLDIVGNPDRDPEIGLSELARTLKELSTWHCPATLADQAEEEYLRAISGGDPDIRKTLVEHREALETRLGMAHASALERLLIRRIALEWLLVHHADILVARHAQGNPRDAKYVEQFRDRANRRFVQAVKALANLRKLLPDGGRPYAPTQEEIVQSCVEQAYWNLLASRARANDASAGSAAGSMAMPSLSPTPTGAQPPGVA